MRTRFLILGVSALFLTTGVAIVACGGSEDTPPANNVDAGDETPITSKPTDGGGDADAGHDSGAECDTSKNFLDSIPDASLADGATTSGECMRCLQNSCNSTLKKCNGDCNCREVVSEALQCFLGGKGDMMSCAMSSDTAPSSATQSVGLQIVGCVQSNCRKECAVDQLFDAGPDAK
ncbi:hypothetical protein AKJ09_01087 [Labilithrix luteola]|uniref:Lipoprotein n=1 Tax=Labilithrix luteola TaxID=1391654 RepID=A0A0K1PLL2_9BACT|nr:hypothetical protein [Labilithrix luteola]AKU94423.1 hypothetical protein AKJ09_01087 [Labilithrix luteola]